MNARDRLIIGPFGALGLLAANSERIAQPIPLTAIPPAIAVSAQGAAGEPNRLF